MPVVIGGDNLPYPVGIGLTDLPNIVGASGPPQFRHHCNGYKALGATDTRIELYVNADSEKTTHFEVFKFT